MSATELPASHAELMDGVYRWQRHIYDLTRKYYLLGRDRLIAGLDVPAGGTVLELGCGTGRNIILAARRYPGARFFGLDISAEMLETATAALAREGLSGRVTLACGDATDFDATALFGVKSFDRVFVSYSLSMIARLGEDGIRGTCCPGTGRLAAYRRFRPAGSAARLVPHAAARLAEKIPCRATSIAARGSGFGICKNRCKLPFPNALSRLCVARCDRPRSIARVC